MGHLQNTNLLQKNFILLLLFGKKNPSNVLNIQPQVHFHSTLSLSYFHGLLKLSQTHDETISNVNIFTTVFFQNIKDAIPKHDRNNAENKLIAARWIMYV